MKIKQICEKKKITTYITFIWPRNIRIASREAYEKTEKSNRYEGISWLLSFRACGKASAGGVGWRGGRGEVIILRLL